ncbi:phytolongin Phyl1.2 [Elaeis guineensis]|uniref:Phytolongin Phyl1.2 n=1 Tax=Elaeis guineensis var. tenera TaxID=51953 RepID=A0A6I9QXA1_ELAGV|nr:phytolongin Phyl1.2 [Elaeis guineensis]XP_029119158.1 phytolongin Phyl1.2 [Elaeis guineensis]XP_029119159.1 phytolongin Phyl1.2 [Elaeis guineensis]
MISDPNDNPIILYACVAKGPTVLAEISSSAASDLATQCLAAAPRFHRHYSHTAGGRIYAFLMENPLIFFAIADETLGKPKILLFLRRLRDVFFASFSIGIGGANERPSPLCFQREFLPELRRLVLPLSFQVDKPPSPPPADPPPSASCGSDSEKKTPKETKKKKKSKVTTEEHSISGIASHDSGAESRVEILAADADPRTKTVQGVWRQNVRTVVLIDLAFCSLLLGIWLSVCRGFHCIGS